MEEIIDEVNQLCSWDSCITAYDGWKLVISSACSSDYVVPFMELFGVSYLSCPFEFSHPKFRLANLEECKRLSELTTIEVEDYVIAIEAETNANLQRQIFSVVLESMTISSEYRAAEVAIGN